MKSCVNSGRLHSSEFLVFSRMRSASPRGSDLNAASSRSVSIAANLRRHAAPELERRAA
jgi:hypothetical protein